MAKKKTDETTFEVSLKQLETAVEKLEVGDLPLSDALQAFEDGLKASNTCRGFLEDARQRVDVLIKENGGDFTLAELEVKDVE